MFINAGKSYVCWQGSASETLEEVGGVGGRAFYTNAFSGVKYR